MNDETRILELMSAKDYAPLTASEIARRLQLKGRQHARLREDLGRLQKTGKIVRVKKDQYCLSPEANLLTGRIRFRAAGWATLKPDSDPGSKSPEEIRIHAENTGVAMHGDLVLARVFTPRRRERRYSPQTGSRGDVGAATQKVQVIRIIERSRTEVTGTLKRRHLCHYVIPDDPRINLDFMVPDPEKSDVLPKPKINDKVLIRLHEWSDRHLAPEGEIIANLGLTHTPTAEFRALLHNYGLEEEFPPAVIAELTEVPNCVRPGDRRQRKDLRKLPTLTIDPDDARDFDDALSVEELPAGETRVGVHIADVSAYVRPGSALDREAQRRGNSTYLVGHVIPMLPQPLSNGICSLVEGKDRLAKSVLFTFSSRGRVVATDYAESVIRSRKRLTYGQALVLMSESNNDKIRKLPAPSTRHRESTGRSLAQLSNAELDSLRNQIRQLWKIARRLRTRRMSKGSLELNMPEVKIYVDEEGCAERIERVLSDESHQLVEEYMLAANESIARSLHLARLPMIYRAHDKPDPARLDEFRDLLVHLGIETGDLTVRREVVRALAQISSHLQSHALRVEFLRTLAQACYRAISGRHYGLNTTHYTHFTSPIRRYSDLVVHRIFEHYLRLKKDGTAKTAAGRGGRGVPYSKTQAGNLAQQLSRTERNSVDAERDSVKLKLLEYFERELEGPTKKRFDAIITEVRNHGLFIELIESMAYGFIHLSTLKDDLFTVSGDRTALTGRRSKVSYHIGQMISVEVYRIDRYKRQIDFTLATSEKKHSPSQAPPDRGKNDRRHRSGKTASKIHTIKN